MGAVKQRKKTGGRDWLPGQSGNPAGRPPNERALSNALREIIDPREYAAVLWRLARGVDEDDLRMAEPSLPALREIGARLEGTPYQQTDPELIRRLEALEARVAEAEHDRSGAA